MSEPVTPCMVHGCPNLVPSRSGCWCYEHLAHCDEIAECDHGAHYCEAAVHFCDEHKEEASE